MESKDKKMTGKSTFSTVLYVVASVAALIGVAALVNNVLLFKNTVAQYVAQGYTADIVMKQLVPAQLLPGIFEPVALYGGIAFILFGIGIVNKKVSKCLMMLSDTNECNEAVVEETAVQNAADEENTETQEQTETSEEVSEEVKED